MQSLRERRDGDIPIGAGLGRARAGETRGAPWPWACGRLLPPEPGVAWAERAKASQSSGQRSDDDEEEYEEAPRSYRYARRSDNSKLIMIGSIAGLALITLVIIAFSLGAGKTTLAEIKRKLGVPANATTVDIEMPQDVFYLKAGIPMEPERFDAHYAYLLYRVQEGIAQIAVERAPWLDQKARIREIRLVR